MPFTKKNFEGDLDDIGSNFDGAEDLARLGVRPRLGYV